MYSQDVFEAHVGRKQAAWEDDYNLLDQPYEGHAYKLAQFNELVKPFSRKEDARFELRGANGVLCTARMPQVGAYGTRVEVRRIDERPRLVEGKNEHDRKMVQDFVWRMTTEIDFFAPSKFTRLKEQIGRMAVEIDGSTQRTLRKHRAFVEGSNEDDTEGVARWRAAMLPMPIAAGGRAISQWLPISLSGGKGSLGWNSGRTKWECEAFSAKLIHERILDEWSKLEVSRGHHVPLGLLAGHLCTRVLPPRKVGRAIAKPFDAPVVSQSEWDDSWHARGKMWAADEEPFPESGGREASTGSKAGGSSKDLEQAFRPVRPSLKTEWRRYPDYKSRFRDYSNYDKVNLGWLSALGLSGAVQGGRLLIDVLRVAA